MDEEQGRAPSNFAGAIWRDFNFFTACCEGRRDIALLSYGFPAVVIYRFGHGLTSISVRLIRWPLLVLYHLLRIPSELILGISIARSANIDGPVMIHHHGQIFIAAGVKMGTQCQVFQGVTIGESGGSKPGRPVIGDRVIIGAGAKILGQVSVGNDARIGANAVVLDDVPAGSVAAGVPAVVKRKPE